MKFDLKGAIRAGLGGKSPKEYALEQVPGALPKEAKGNINRMASRALAALSEGRIEDLKLFLTQIRDATE